jgi:hypothetical protein
MRGVRLDKTSLEVRARATVDLIKRLPREYGKYNKLILDHGASESVARDWGLPSYVVEGMFYAARSWLLGDKTRRRYSKDVIKYVLAEIEANGLTSKLVVGKQYTWEKVARKSEPELAASAYTGSNVLLTTSVTPPEASPINQTTTFPFEPEESIEERVLRLEYKTGLKKRPRKSMRQWLAEVVLGKKIG